MSEEVEYLDAPIENPFPSPQPSPDELQRMITEAVAAAEAAKRGPAVKPRHCASCYEWTINYGANGVCIGCGSRGLPPSPDYVCCRRLGMVKGNFFPGIANTLSILSRDYWGKDKEVTVSELLDEEVVSFEQLADLFDEAIRRNGPVALKRAPTAAELAAKEAEAAAQQRDTAVRGLLAQKKSLIGQLETANNRLSEVNRKLEELGEGNE